MERECRLAAIVTSSLAILMLGGCASGAQTVDGAVQASAATAVQLGESEQITPTMHAPAAASPVPTLAATPTAALGSALYYLAYARDTEDGVELVLADPGGTGRRGYRVPVELKGLPLDLNGISLGGEYFAYHTGDLDESGNDLTLHVMRLADEQELLAVRLVTDDVGERLLALGEELVVSPPEQLMNAYLDGVTAETIAGEAWSALEAGIRSVDWSPDGRLLAFAGQIDGATSDVHTFDVTTGEIRWLTDGPTQVQYLDWSPNGRWIAHGSAYWVGMGTYMINNFVSRDGANVVSMDVGGQFGNEWYGSDWYLVHNGANGPGSFGLKMISPDQGAVRMLWERPFSGYALDLSAGLLLVSQTELMDPERQSAGTYLVDLERGSSERVAEPAFWVRRWRREGELGLLASSEGILAVGVDGEVRVLLEGEDGVADPSPSGRKIAFSRYRDVQGLRVLDVESGEKTTVDVPGGSCVSWRPDEEAVAFIADDALYFNDLQGNPSVLVDAEPQQSYLNYVDCNVMWVEGPEG
jgi:roadblock/LC7 domain-containing protein